jgi:tetratricopeptide (TPR) repeat protein
LKPPAELPRIDAMPMQCPESGFRRPGFQHGKEKVMVSRFESFTRAALTLAIAGAAAGLIGPVFAADTPFSAPAPAAAAPKTDRMASGRAAVQAGDWKKAIAEFSAAVQAQPNSADAHNMLAFSYRKQPTPDLPKAFEHYNTALKIDPNHKGAHEYIGEAYLMDKKPAKAEEHLGRLKAICGGSACEEYEDLAKAVAAYKSRNP